MAFIQINRGLYWPAAARIINSAAIYGSVLVFDISIRKILEDPKVYKLYDKMTDGQKTTLKSKIKGAVRYYISYFRIQNAMIIGAGPAELYGNYSYLLLVRDILGGTIFKCLPETVAQKHADDNTADKAFCYINSAGAKGFAKYPYWSRGKIELEAEKQDGDQDKKPIYDVYADMSEFDHKHFKNTYYRVETGILNCVPMVGRDILKEIADGEYPNVEYPHQLENEDRVLVISTPAHERSVSLTNYNFGDEPFWHKAFVTKEWEVYKKE